MRTTLIAVLLLASLAGCTAPGKGPAAAASEGPAHAPAAFASGNDASGCYEAVGVFLVPPAVAQSALPPGWHAADAQGLLGLPIPSGKGVVWLNGYTCTTAQASGGSLQGGEIGILVDAPHVAGGNVSAAAIHVYQFTQVSSAAALRSTLGGVGFPVVAGKVTATPQGAGPLEFGNVAVASGNGTLHSFAYAVVQDQPLTTDANFWHATADGLAYFHYALKDIPVMKGAITSCALAGQAAELTHATSCGPGDALALVAPKQAWTSTFSWMPGARVVA
jgi:hypothetical protein